MRERIIQYADDIRQIIEDCEAVQESDESQFTKEYERVIAYKSILELVKK